MKEINSNNSWDYVIIGGGINGLAIGALLVNDGKKILVLEKENQIGGRAKVIKKDGFTLDNGIHLIKYGKSSTLYKILSILFPDEKIQIKPIKSHYLNIGEEYKELEEKLKPSCINKSKWIPKGWIKVPSNVNLMRRCDFFDIWKLIRIYTTCFKCKFSDIKEKNLSEFLMDHRLCRNYGCVAIERYIKLISCALTHVFDSNIISAGEIMRTLKWSSKMEVIFGYPSEGWNNIINRLKRKVESNGKIITDCEVKRIILKKNEILDEIAIIDYYKVLGVVTNKGNYTSDKVIIAIPPKLVSPLFLKSGIIRRLTRGYQKILDSFVPVSGISIDIAVNKLLYHGRVFLYTENPYGYGSIISNIEPTLAPKGKQLFSFLFPLPFKMINNENAIEEKIENCHKLIYKLYPKIKDNIDFERVLVHEIVDCVEVNTLQYMDKRPKSKVPGIKGCYLIGDYLNVLGKSGEMGYNSVLSTYESIKNWDDFFMNQYSE